MMTYLDCVVWAIAGTEEEKAEFWMLVNNQPNTLNYTNCPRIKAFWRSPLGRFILAWYSLRYFVRSIPRKVAIAVWRVGWEYRMVRRRIARR